MWEVPGCESMVSNSQFNKVSKIHKQIYSIICGTEGHSSRKICLSQEPWLTPVILGLRRSMLEDIKCEEILVYVVSLGLARTTQQNYFSNKTQTDTKNAERV